MIEVVTPDIAFLYRDKLEAMFRLRHRVFKSRMGWDVNSRDGKERDVYDLLRPIYLLSTNDAGQVLGSLRLLPTTGPYMLRDVFPELLEGGAAPEHPQIWEPSRFAVDVGPGGSERRRMVSRVTSELLAGLVEWSLMFGITEIVGVYDVGMGKVMSRLGIDAKWESAPRRIGNTTTVAGRFDVTDDVLARIRQISSLTDSVLVDRTATEVSYAA